MSGKIPLDLYGRNVVTTLVPSFLNGCSSFLRVTKTIIEAGMYLNFCQIQQLTTELAALEGLKINVSTFSRLLLI